MDSLPQARGIRDEIGVRDAVRQPLSAPARANLAWKCSLPPVWSLLQSYLTAAHP